MEDTDGSGIDHADHLMEAARLWQKEGVDRETFLRAASSFWNTSEALFKFMAEDE